MHQCLRSLSGGEHKRPLRILHYTGVYAPAWSYGGPPRSISTLCEGLAGLGHHVTVLTTNAGLGERSELIPGALTKRGGVDVYYFAASFNRMGIRSPLLEAAVRQRASQYDVIHVTGVWQPTSRVACRAAQNARIPYVCSPRGALGVYSFTQRPWKKWPYFWLWERSNLNRAAASHFTSRMEQIECARLRLRPPSFVVPNSVDLDSWRRDEAGGKEWRRSCGLAEDDYILLYAGRLHHKKGLDLLADVCARLPINTKWKLVLVGFDEDGSGAKLKNAFSAIGRSDRLLLIPGLESGRLATVYSAADVFVFPSLHENFGNVVVEALACGCPVVVSDQVGAVDQMEGMDGVTVLPRLVDRWERTLVDKIKLRERLSEGIRWEVSSRFSTEAVARKMASIYDGLASP